MNRYDSYKDSGVEWIGDIPSSWSVKRVKELYENRNEKNDVGNTNFLSVMRNIGVIPYSEKGNVGNKTSEDINKYKLVYPNDLVINPMNIIIGSVGLSVYHGSLSNVYIILKNKDYLNPLFGYYVFQNKDFQKNLHKICYGIMELRESLNKIEFFVEKLPHPPLSEQQQIVSFLDTKTSLIDSLIEKTQRKIELLKEKRTSLINEVVTKGLNPNEEMKDSGVEWIGEIPSHWGRTKLKRYVSIFTGYSFKSDWFGEEGIPVIRISNIQDRFIDFTKSVYLTENYLTEYPDYVIKRDDTLICLTGSLTGKVGKFNHEVGLLNQRVGKIIVRGDKVLKGFIDKVFFFQKFQGLIKEMGEGISENFPNVSHLDVVELEIPLPPLSEQQQIVEYLDEQTQLIVKTISIEEKRIELLKEYRQSLISEVVTGKRKVVN